MPARWSLDAHFVKAVHTALKRLHRDEALSKHPLAMLAAVESRCRPDGWPDTSLGRAAALRCILEEALKALSVHDPAGACLLERHFWEGATMVRLAQEQSVAESTLYARQARALRALARILWSMEQAAREEAADRKDHLIRNLPFPTYRRLLGRGKLLAQLRERLTDGVGPGLVCLEGLGGLGKTALAHRFATWAAGTSHFADIGWVTASQQEYTIWRGIVGQPGERSGLTFESVLDSIALQLDCEPLRLRAVAEKKTLLRAILGDAPHLIIVDDLETGANCHTLVSQLWQLANPTRFLFTSCRSLGDHPQITSLAVQELAEADSVQLIRFEGAEQGIDTITEADDRSLRRVYQVTGGHPLAIKLVVGQARSLPLDRALHRLRESRGRRSEDLYRFIYQQSWELLSPAARCALLAMASLPASGGGWTDLLAAAGLPEDRLERAVQELAGMSLLNVTGVEKKWYAIHQLTHTCLASGVLQRWTPTDSAQTDSRHIRRDGEPGRAVH